MFYCYVLVPLPSLQLSSFELKLVGSVASYSVCYLAVPRSITIPVFSFSLSFLGSLPPVSSVTPLQADQFALELQHHPDRQLVNYVLDGISNGFRVGFSPSHKLKSAKSNKPSALQHAAVVDEYLAHEVSLGRVAGPFTSPPLPNLHISSFGVIPKRGQPGKWRLIVDLSSPGGASVNDGINPDEFSLHYITVDKVISLVSQFGRGALMAKFDVESAYRNVPIHPLDRYLLGMKWRHHFYVDLALPFGLRSAPYISNSIADLVEWILINNHQIPDLLHYLDDFLSAGPPDSPQCALVSARVLRRC